MGSNELYLLIKSGPLLEQAEKYRKAYIKHANAKWKLVKSFPGAVGYHNDLCGGLYSVVFKGDEKPEGWVEARGVRGRATYRPGKKSPDLVLFKQLGDGPKVTDYMEAIEYWPTSVSYVTHKGKKLHSSGSFRVGGFWGPEVLWFDTKGPLCIAVADIESAVADHRKSHKEYNKGQTLKFTTIIKPQLPPGVKPILQEEWALMKAKRDRKVAA